MRRLRCLIPIPMLPDCKLHSTYLIRTAAIIAAVCVGANPGASPLTVAAPAVSPITSSLSGVFQVTFALGLVLLAIFATAWVLRRLGAGQLGQAGHVRLISGVAVGPKERVVVVEVQDTWLVLGVTAVEITPLHTLPKPPALSTEGQPISATFAERLAQVIRRQAKPTNPEQLP